MQKWRICWNIKTFMFCENASISTIIRPKLNYHSLAFCWNVFEKCLKKTSLSFQVKNENKTSLILALFGSIRTKYLNFQTIFGFQNFHVSNMNINIWRKIFEYSNIFKYLFVHWTEGLGVFFGISVLSISPVRILVQNLLTMTT